MNYEEFKDIQLDFILDKLSESRKDEVASFIVNNPDAKAELESLEKFYAPFITTEIPEISAKMDDTFYEFLDESIDKNAQNKPSILDIIKNFFFPENQVSIPKLSGLVLSLVVLGFFLGKGVYFSSNQNNLATIESEKQALQAQLVLNLIDESSASKRLQGVSEANKLALINENIIDALFKTLNNDPSVNVRMAAVESLSTYTQNPKVRAGLVKSIANQTSPLVQIALADLMVALQEKESIESMKELLQQPDIDKTLKLKINESIDNIVS